MISAEPVFLIFSGGVALGSYQAGAYERLKEELGGAASWIAGSSVGAINAALIAGSAPAERCDVLRTYWQHRPVGGQDWMPRGRFRHAANWMSAMQARIFGSPRHVAAAGPRLTFSSFYDLGPTIEYLRKAVDFGRLNSGDMRLTVATVDVETGDVVHFDTKRDWIEVDHILASCGFLPEFAPVEIAGRLLGDGGLAANAPIEPVLDESEGKDVTVFVVDLFARDGCRPDGIEASLARKNALLFGNQTYCRLDTYRRFWSRRPPGSPVPTVMYLSYRPVEGEAGPEMAFDFSAASARDRWSEGRLDMEEAIRRRADVRSNGAIVASIRRTAGPNT